MVNVVLSFDKDGKPSDYFHTRANEIFEWFIETWGERPHYHVGFTFDPTQERVRFAMQETLLELGMLSYWFMDPNEAMHFRLKWSGI